LQVGYARGERPKETIDRAVSTVKEKVDDAADKIKEKVGHDRDRDPRD
jgi:hypothetical protein